MNISFFRTYEREMSSFQRLATGILIFLLVYSLSLFVFPHVLSLPLPSGVVPQISFLFLSLLLVGTVGKGRFREFGFQGTSLRTMGRALGIAFAVSAPLTFLNLVIMSILMGPSAGPEGGPSPSGILELILTVWILASTCEEIFYRGFLQSFLNPLRNYGITIAAWRIQAPILCSAALFALGHLCLLGSMPGPFVGLIVFSCFVNGILAGHFRDRSGSLLPAIGVHMMFNVTGMAIPSILMLLMSP
ncbi:MAG TPA: type II CAAX endopeptidase family protein [Thermoanaerobaculia bacterium]|nr:type II CAAX endopeptidase family protein [Thermoanaerobaculia bacterium]HUM30100.1 type II CAAX endopeptidase family protein [Thermoanaerobaculia bacterium]HXK68797.1 type II CAAX endopeptidase family protein [Thermoanaerobaculia bacterium]